VPYHALTFDPTAKVLHYVQEIFEGLKSYGTNGAGPYLFRPTENLKRFNLSAIRMAMPPVDESMALEGIKAIVSYSKDLIPTESEASLYVRPFMIATDIHLGMKPSETFKFMIVASPSQAYFQTSSVNVWVETDNIRAAHGGIGAAKTGGNYAASLLAMIRAKEKGFDQVLWLDAKNKEYIEEMSGMNFFAVYGKVIKTPKLTNTILDGITRRSIIDLARHNGYQVEESLLSYKELFSDIEAGKCNECFACGTAVIITPIKGLATEEQSVQLKQEFGEVTSNLRKSLLDLQEGRADDPFGWRIEV
jgi:branched-chain amino acid aminotransferase